MTPAPLSPTSRIPSLLRPLYEFLFPPSCFACAGALAAGEDMVCAQCWSSVQEVREEDPLYREALRRLTDPGPLDDLIGGFVFARDGVIQALLHRMKYDGMSRVGEAFGVHLARSPAGARIAGGRPVLVPVPLHRAKERERGYNQSAAICRGIAAVTGLPVVEHGLRRRRYTRSQTGLDIEQRARNVGGAFDLNPSARDLLYGKACLLVDDVVTTGATLAACAAVLRAHGASAVSGAVVAIAPHTVSVPAPAGV